MSLEKDRSKSEDGKPESDIEKANRKAGARSDLDEAANSEGGEDESSASQDGKDDHLHEDQKPTTK